MAFTLQQLRAKCQRLGLQILIAAFLQPCYLALAASPAPTFLLGTDAEADTLTGKWYRHIYEEAFRRLGIPLSFVVMPTARLTLAADDGEVHGQATRVLAYSESHPDQIRVNESVHEVHLALWFADSNTKVVLPKRIEDLSGGKWTVDYRRGVAVCENLIKPLVPPTKLADVTTIEQALKKLLSGRTDLYCEFDLAIQGELLGPHFKGETGVRSALDLKSALPLYPYLHKSQASLAPKLGSVLSKMKAEGLIDRYFRDAQREMEAAR